VARFRFADIGHIGAVLLGLMSGSGTSEKRHSSEWMCKKIGQSRGTGRFSVHGNQPKSYPRKELGPIGVALRGLLFAQ
jgi:hypothetical protein